MLRARLLNVNNASMDTMSLVGAVGKNLVFAVNVRVMNINAVPAKPDSIYLTINAMYVILGAHRVLARVGRPLLNAANANLDITNHVVGVIKKKKLVVHVGASRNAIHVHQDII